MTVSLANLVTSESVTPHFSTRPLSLGLARRQAGVPVVINGVGQLGVAVSSRQFKDDIKPMEKTSEAILALRPVAVQYKRDIDPDCDVQSGLVAEDVEKINPDLVVRDKEGKPYSVRYEAVNAMLLNEFLKEHRKVMALQTQLDQQQRKFESKFSDQEKQIESLAASLRKVSAEIETSRPDPHIVANRKQRPLGGGTCHGEQTA